MRTDVGVGAVMRLAGSRPGRCKTAGQPLRSFRQAAMKQPTKPSTAKR